MSWSRWLLQLWAYIAGVGIIVLPLLYTRGFLFFIDMAYGPNTKFELDGGWFLANLIGKVIKPIIAVDVYQKFLIVLALCLCVLSGKKIASHFTKNLFSQSLVGLFFLFNPFVYDRMMYGQVGIIFAYACTGLSLGFAYDFVKTKSISSFLLHAISAGFAMQFAPHFLVLWMTIMLFFFIVNYQENRLHIKKIIFWILTVMAIVLIFNLAYLFTYFREGSSLHVMVVDGIQEDDYVIFQTAGKSTADAIINVLLLSGFWGKEQMRYFNYQLSTSSWTLHVFFLLTIIGVGLYRFWKSNRNVRRFGLTLVVFITMILVLALGRRIHLLKDFYHWIEQYASFAKGFREPQKWVALLVMFYGIILTFVLDWVMHLKFSKELRRVIQAMFLLIIVLQFPFLLWGGFRQIPVVPYPITWKEADEFIVNRYGCDMRGLFLPWHLYMHVAWVGRIINNPAKHFFTCPIVSGTNVEIGNIYDNSGSQEGTLVFRWISSKGRGVQIKELPFDYIILTKEVDWKTYDWLDSLHLLKMIFENQDIVIYEINKT